MARRFEFRLQPVLEHRERREDLLRADLGQALTALALQEERALDAERRIDDELAALRLLLDGGAALHELRARHGALAVARARAVHERAEAERLEAVAVERRADLVRASQDRQALEQLRGRAREEHLREEARAEVIALDELSARRARPRHGGVAA